MKWKERLCALFLEISIENAFFFLQFLKENVLFCQKKCIFWHSVRTFLPQIKICRRVSKKMMPIPKTYVLTLNKKNKIFFQGRPPKKFNGGGKLKTHKKPYFFHVTEISGRFFGRGGRKSARWNFLAMVVPIFCGF